MIPIGLQSAVELKAMLAAGRISAVELLDEFAARVERLDAETNLVVALDLERARGHAAASDAARAAGEAQGPLAGLPITIKECWEAEGMIASCGFPFLAEHRPARDADAVAQLRQAGAVIFGKTNLPQGASDWQSFNPIYGLSRNPWDLGRSPGGSSGGSAGAVAMGFTAFELGSDIGGSIRIPAHFCGVFGHKASYGLVPMRGHIPPMPGAHYEVELGVAGPLARSAADLALVLPAISKPALAPLLKPARHERLADFRIALWMGEGSDYRLDGTYGAMIEAVIADLERAGARVERVALPVDPALSYDTYLKLLFAIVGAAAPGEAAHFAACIPDDPTGIAAVLAANMQASLPEWFAALEVREQLVAQWAEFFTRYDVLLTPQVPVLAFPHMADGSGVHSEQLARRISVNGEPAPYLDFTWQGLATVARLPATCMPSGRLSPDGLPGGVQIIGPYMEDFTTIRFAELAAEATGGFLPPPRALA